MPQKRQNRGKNGTECEESATGPGGLPRAQTSGEFLLGQRAVKYNVRGLRCTGGNRSSKEATEEGHQADPVSRNKSAQKRQHKNRKGLFCSLFASLKQSLRGASLRLARQCFAFTSHNYILLLLWCTDEGYLAPACPSQHIDDSFSGANTLATAMWVPVVINGLSDIMCM